MCQGFLELKNSWLKLEKIFLKERIWLLYIISSRDRVADIFIKLISHSLFVIYFSCLLKLYQNCSFSSISQALDVCISPNLVFLEIEGVF